MKKIVLSLALVATVAFVSCKDTAKEPTADEAVIEEAVIEETPTQEEAVIEEVAPAADAETPVTEAPAN